jgi:hypothetical protein
VRRSCCICTERDAPEAAGGRPGGGRCAGGAPRTMRCGTRCLLPKAAHPRHTMLHRRRAHSCRRHGIGCWQSARCLLDTGV